MVVAAIAAALLALSLPSAAAAQDTLPAWRLSARPTLAIGGEGNPRTEFLRVGTVLRLPNGDIVVPNAGTGEVRVFDRAGRYLRALGRSGSGPGEFGNLNLVGAHPAFGTMNRRSWGVLGHKHFSHHFDQFGV